MQPIGKTAFYWAFRKQWETLIMNTQVKIFQMNEYDWYLAETAGQASAHYNFDYGPLNEEENQPRELDEKELESTFFTYESGVKLSFADRLKCMIELGDTAPQFFATTEV